MKPSRAIALALLLAFGPASATELHVQLHGLSYHARGHYVLKDPDGVVVGHDSYNYLNLGAGLRYEHSPALSFQAGTYRTSYWSDDPRRIDPMYAQYVIIDWLPLSALGGRFGLAGGMIKGYDGNQWRPKGALAARWGSRHSITLRGGPSAGAGFVATADFGLRL